MNARKEKLLTKMHPYEITEPKSEGGEGGRHIIGMYTEKERSYAQKQRMRYLKNCSRFNEQHYKRYFAQSKLHTTPARKIDALLLESECNRLVKEYSMSRKEWNNVKTILRGCFEYAVRKKYIAENPMDGVKILVKYRQMVKKTGRTETYNTEESENLNQYLDKMYAETEDVAFLAVKISLQTR